MKDLNRTYKTYSAQYGALIEATSQIYCDYEPADPTTTEALAFWLGEIGIFPDRPTSKIKYIRALSDFCMAYTASIEGRVIWPSANAEFSGGPYGGEIVRRLKKALEGRYLKKLQLSSKKDKLCAVYEIRVPDFGHLTRFKPHGLSPVVQVRSQKVRRSGKQTGGHKLSLKRFDQEQIAKLQTEMRKIRACMAAHPLTHPNGATFSTITRIFNNSDLEQGGRSYGSYQNYSESERLTMTIDREPVCEIDLKSCYLAIIAAKQKTRLPDDPYAVIPYVQEHLGTDRFTEVRNLMKLVVSKLLSVDGKPTTFPKGEKYRGSDGRIQTRTVKQKFNVPKKVTAKSLYAQIYDTYPFLRKRSLNVFQLMNIESNIMTATTLQLALKDIPTYPVHDCLICKASDEGRVLEALKDILVQYLGSIPALDVTYADGTYRIYKASYPEHFKHYFEEDMIVHPGEEDDFLVIDDQDYQHLAGLTQYQLGKEGRV
ncbi:hypothetical protein DSM14862_02428 [Sulfitobacter indolifex]|uniref:DNA-directed DNA polymerase n=1 Tax=Sulfitobacter indolifex HEL-45 TaxID=391624 RepID=A0ABP2DB28_9RHOB|nr:hypothetical protein [Sulfitobacter indolifex]EDQ05443.1 hypothetical protein OIHEL45_01495 [Sulfitobacter indolifex HEL-45]UOA19620.1 hypothetical protein DSM14862_02428 [Sulfitobacter indolifex]